MALKYEIPAVGDTLSEAEITKLSDTNGYRRDDAGNEENGGLIITLRDCDYVGMTFLLIDQGTSTFKRVY